MLTFTGTVDFEREDGGRALIAELDGDGDLFIRLQSYDEWMLHTQAKELAGRKVKITIEVQDEPV